MNIRRKHISELASQVLRTSKQLHAPIDVQAVAIAQNAVVRISDAEDQFAGYLFRDAPGGSAIIGVNRKHSPTRQRFTIAHEIGHLLLHAPSPGEPIHFDRIFMRRDVRSSQGTDPKEIEANIFAAELLMPGHLIAHFLESEANFNSEEELIDRMAVHFGVSSQAMGIRLSALGYV